MKPPSIQPEILKRGASGVGEGCATGFLASLPSAAAASAEFGTGVACCA